MDGDMMGYMKIQSQADAEGSESQFNCNLQRLGSSFFCQCFNASGYRRAASAAIFFAISLQRQRLSNMTVFLKFQGTRELRASEVRKIYRIIQTKIMETNRLRAA